MRKNISGQKIGAQMVTAADGTAFTGAVTVYVTGDAGTQAVGSVGSGACTHEGNGYHTYAPSQAETNYDLIAFTFIGTGAVPSTVQIYTRHDSNVTAMASDTLTAAALAADAVAEIQSGLSTLTQAQVRSAVGLASANLDAQIAAIPAAVEAELDITVLPLDATVVDRVAGTTINLFTDETPSVAVAVVDSSGAAVDLTNLTLEVVIELRPSTDVAVIANANISKSNGSFSFTVPSAVTNAARACKWALRKTTDSSVLVQGDLFVNYAPTNDT